ncbi:MAG: Lactose transport system permease protein LacG [Lentisphaerae bacterium ADurb.Bin242]|nr:MAG: Lactose transport system permease protein LacG [Lentisphaerae bacterium ADurb.Bin242]
MPIIGNVERKHWKTRLLSLSIHGILLLGAVTMVYPLLLMISGSIKSDVDFFKFSILPEYIYDMELLYKKYLFTKHNNNSNLIFHSFRIPSGAILNIPVPENPNRERYRDYQAFLAELKKRTPHYWRGIGMAVEPGVDPLVQRRFRSWLKAKYGEGDKGLRNLNRTRKTNFGSWDAPGLPAEQFYLATQSTDYSGGIFPDVLEFKNTQLGPLETYWFDLDAVFAAALRGLYANDLALLNRKLGTSCNQWSDIALPRSVPEDRPALAEFWGKYVRNNVNYGFLSLDGGCAPEWAGFLKKRYNGNLKEINVLYRINVSSFAEIPVPLRIPASGCRKTDWENFVRTAVPDRFLRVETLAWKYRDFLREKYGSLEKINSVYNLGFHSFGEVPLPGEYPAGNLAREKDWLAFADTLPAEKTGISRNAISEYRAFIEEKYRKNGAADLKELSSDYGVRIRTRSEIPFHTEYPAASPSRRVRDIYREFVKNPNYASFRTIPRPAELRNDWSRFLERKYGNVEELNRKWGKIHTTFEQVAPPAAECEWFLAVDHRRMLIREYLTRNYAMVFDTLISNGKAARNTLIYCVLAVLAALLVNPLCAYALSRYKMAPAYKILLFVMLPMAFPPMVLGIPQFLLIKKLGLLNTFAALILPSMANGYMIFLLKGFFDSLPRELFESAAIDGAGEWTVFWHIAMGLSTPILSVLALGTFTVAYGNFMMAFLLCQDRSMWTMMVYLYQLQQITSQSVGFAALIVAAVPTLLVFIFCQNIIIKGIVVPTEK